MRSRPAASANDEAVFKRLGSPRAPSRPTTAGVLRRHRGPLQRGSLVVGMTVTLLMLALSAQTRVAGGGDLNAMRAGLPRELRAMLDRVEGRCGQVRVVSGYRPGATFACKQGRCLSYHALNRAVDFTVQDRACAVAQLKPTWRGGFITYSGSPHLHVDLGPRLRAHQIFRATQRARSAVSANGRRP